MIRSRPSKLRIGRGRIRSSGSRFPVLLIVALVEQFDDHRRGSLGEAAFVEVVGEGEENIREADRPADEVFALVVDPCRVILAATVQHFAEEPFRSFAVFGQGSRVVDQVPVGGGHGARSKRLLVAAASLEEAEQFAQAPAFLEVVAGDHRDEVGDLANLVAELRDRLAMWQVFLVPADIPPGILQAGHEQFLDELPAGGFVGVGDEHRPRRVLGSQLLFRLANGFARFATFLKVRNVSSLRPIDFRRLARGDLLKHFDQGL
jgi:hypothetical protein